LIPCVCCDGETSYTCPMCLGQNLEYASYDFGARPGWRRGPVGASSGGVAAWHRGKGTGDRSLAANKKIVHLATFRNFSIAFQRAQ
jgi:hypothetical protein